MSDPDDPEAPPPLLGSWRNLYAAVLVNLALMIAAGALLTWTYG